MSGIVLAMTLLGSGNTDASPFLPSRVECLTNFGYDTNLLNGSDEELDAFRRNDPDSFFLADRLEDYFFQGEIEADWKLGRPFGFRTKIRPGYRRIQYLNETIYSEDRFSLKLISRPGDRTRFSLWFAYQPQIYGRHRLDKDAAPGEPMFRAETHQRWEIEAKVNRRVAQRWEVLFELGNTYRDYTDAFDERDRNRFEVATGARWFPEAWLELGLLVGFRTTKSRNEPDLGKDLSNRELVVRPNVRVKERGLIPEIELSYRSIWRYYTSDNPEDRNHYKRDDLYGELRVELIRSLTRNVALDFRYSYKWRSGDLDSGFEIDFDEEGSFSESVLAGGFLWRWEAD